MKIIYLTLLIFAINLQSKGQDSLNKRNNINGPIRIFVEKGLFGTIQFQTPSQKTLSFKEVKLKLKNYEPSASEYRIYQRSKITTLVMSSIGLAPLLISNSSSDHNNSPSYPLLAVGLGATAIDLVYFYKTTRHFRRALLIYNNQFK
jgi:hypothetical protein